MPVCESPESKSINPANFYRSRRMPDTSFYQLVDKYFDEFKREYPRKYREDFGYWRPVVDDVVQKFLKCGVLDYIVTDRRVGNVLGATEGAGRTSCTLF